MNNVAVVILNYNGRELLRKFLPGVLSHSDGARIVVADNGSSDGSCNMLKAEYPAVDILETGQNLGFCGGYNFALARVDADYLVLLNSDVAVTPGWLAPLTRWLDSEPSVAAVQPRVLSYAEPTKFEYAGAAGGFIDSLGYPFCRGRIFAKTEVDTGQYADARPVFWATGACLMIRSKVFHAMGGFDPDFFAHMEEIDLCWRLNRAALQVYYVGESTVYHVGGGTLSRIDPYKTYLNFRNGLFLMVKNMKVAELLWKLPLRLLLDWLAAVSFLTGGSFRAAASVLKAHLHFACAFGRTLRKRKDYERLGFQVRPGIVYPGSIVIAYFVRSKRTFRDLGL